MSSTQPTTTPNAVTFTDGLRRLADLLDERDAVAPYDDYRHLLPVDDAEQIAETVRKLGGRWEKPSVPADGYFTMVRDLGGGVTIQVYAPRANVCERRVTGTRKVLRPAAPDQAPTIEVPMVEVEEEIVEWVCPDSLLAAREQR